MSVTTERPAATQSVSTTDAPTVRRRRIPWIPVAVGAMAVVTVGVIASWSQPPSATPAQVEWSSAYGVGSSVYSEQVPRSATAADRADYWAAAYGPGSSTYPEQVPPAARTSPWTDAYAPGSATYAEQVPAAARTRPGADGYGPGSTTFAEQVPRG